MNELTRKRIDNLQCEQWNDKMIEDFKSMYYHKTNEELSAIFNKTDGAIKQKAYSLGLKREVVEIWDRESILKFAQDFYNKYGYAPKKQHYNGTLKNISAPSERSLNKYFSGMTEVNNILNLPSEKEQKQIEFVKNKIAQSNNFIKTFYTENKYHPSVTEYEANRPRLAYNRRALEKYYNMSYEDYVFQLLDIKREITTKEDISKIITEISKVHPPQLKEVCAILNKDGKTILKIIEDSFHNFSKSIGVKSKQKSKHPKNKNDIDNALLKMYDKLGRMPTSMDIDRIGDVSWATIIREYGDMKTACESNNIEYTFHSGFGKMGIDNNGEFCRSTGEVDITNFLIKNNIDFKKEEFYSKILNDESLKWRCDWLIFTLNGNYVVEYFGMDSVEYKKKTNAKINRLQGSDYKDRCIFIYMKDLQKLSLEEIFKDVLNNIESSEKLG